MSVAIQVIKTVGVSILKKIGTDILISLCENALKVLRDRKDNSIDTDALIPVTYAKNERLNGRK